MKTKPSVVDVMLPHRERGGFLYISPVETQCLRLRDRCICLYGIVGGLPRRCRFSQRRRILRLDCSGY